MKKTFTINLNQSVFNIDEDAYQTLSSYLSSLEKHFSKEADSQDILSDIEARIAEKFQASSKSKNVITQKDVDTVISQIGTVKDITSQDGSESTSKADSILNDASNFFTSFKNKKIYRDTDNKVLAGVVSGIASYLSIDVTLLRILFALLLFIPYTSGFIVLFYAIFWYVAPEAKSTVDKLEMKGESLTLSSLDSEVKSTSNSSPKVESPLQKIFLFPFRVLGRFFELLITILKKLLPLLSAFIGFAIVLSIALSIAALTFFFVQLLINDTTPYLGFSIKDILSPAQFYSLLASSFFVAFLPLVFVLQVGSSFLSRRSTFSLSGTLFLFFFWLFSLVVLGVTSLNILPEKEAQIRTLIEERFHPYSSQQFYDIKDFQAIKLSYPAKLYIVKGDSYSVSIQGTSAQLAQITLDKEGDTLLISSPVTSFHQSLFSYTPSPRIEITLPYLSYLKLSGAAKAQVTGLDNRLFVLEASGASNITLSGETGLFQATLSGASRLNSLELVADNVTLDAAGASSINLNARDSLDVKLSGASKLFYLGSPVIKQDVSGASLIEAIDPDSYLLDPQTGSKVTPTPEEDLTPLDPSLSPTPILMVN